MSTIAETPNVTTADRVTDAVERVAHASHQAHILKSMAQDAIEGGVHAARRTMKRRVRQLEDLADSATLRIRRRPLAAIGTAAAVGMAVGLVIGVIARRTCSRD
jgi:ElaB/YqjD/DUF883 family membrane-anchored ribosome-binding protein